MRFKFILPIAFALVPAISSANTCEIDIGSSDSMAYDTKQVSVPASCEEFTVNFHHNGALPVGGMGHNWVLSKTADVNDIARKGADVGLKNDYLPDDDRIITATPLIGGGESATVKIKTSELSSDGKYTYFCTFPGHSYAMRGELKFGS